MEKLSWWLLLLTVFKRCWPITFLGWPFCTFFNVFVVSKEFCGFFFTPYGIFAKQICFGLHIWALFENFWAKIARNCTDKKEKIFLISQEIQSGAVAKSYMRKGFLIYEEMRKYFPIYEEAVSHIWLCNWSILNFLIYEENLIRKKKNVSYNVSYNSILDPYPVCYASFCQKMSKSVQANVHAPFTYSVYLYNIHLTQQQSNTNKI